MKQLLSVFLLLVGIIFFSACSTKRVFEAKEVKADWQYFQNMEKPIVDVSSDIAMLEDRKIISKNRAINGIVEIDYRLISRSDGWIITASIDGNLKLRKIDSNNSVEKFELKKTIAAASVNDDTLAVIFADNEMALFSIESKSLLFKEQGGSILAVDSRIVSPYFLDGVIIFPTLDGKILIVNRKTNKKLRVSIISSEESFNNVIYFELIDKKIIAATAYQILSMSQKEIRQKYEIRNITYDGINLFLTTKQGELISLTPNLELNAKLKFPFAHFLGLIIRNEKIYALEKEGYLIVAPTDLSSFEIYEVDIDEGFVFVGEDKFYIHDMFISIK